MLAIAEFIAVVLILVVDAWLLAYTIHRDAKAKERRHISHRVRKILRGAGI